jgi:DNA replication initiation complex subunit (GINS family)
MLNYSKLREMQRSEIASSELCPVEEDFYTKLKGFLEEKRGEAFGSQKLLVIKEYENLRKIARAIVNKRNEKLVLLALRGKKETTGMTAEEADFLGHLSKDIEENDAQLAFIFEENGNGRGVGGKKDNIKRIRLLKNISPYKGLDENVYGPFNEGDEAELPAAEAQWLLKEKMAELLA